MVKLYSKLENNVFGGLILVSHDEIWYRLNFEDQICISSEGIRIHGLRISKPSINSLIKRHLFTFKVSVLFLPALGGVLSIFVHYIPISLAIFPMSRLPSVGWIETNDESSPKRIPFLIHQYFVMINLNAVLTFEIKSNCISSEIWCLWGKFLPKRIWAQ